MNLAPDARPVAQGLAAQGLNEALLAAHETANKAALVDLYAQAATLADSEDAEAFFLTNAYVFALDCGAPDADRLWSRLRDLGREE